MGEGKSTGRDGGIHSFAALSLVLANVKEEKHIHNEFQQSTYQWCFLLAPSSLKFAAVTSRAVKTTAASGILPPSCSASNLLTAEATLAVKRFGRLVPYCLPIVTQIVGRASCCELSCQAERKWKSSRSARKDLWRGGQASPLLHSPPMTGMVSSSPPIKAMLVRLRFAPCRESMFEYVLRNERSSLLSLSVMCVNRAQG
ncbi:unnamed protein product [Taenia asiatica]|uniref:Uncharacterized protein n=1 Tax=Taenia asiatica TaxID=60517 RepID=A0A0R3WGK1_TAEAS|nr:unnamed protein product [Taenia asiatica]